MRVWAKFVFIAVIAACSVYARAQAEVQAAPAEAPVAKTGDEVKALLAGSYMRNTLGDLNGPYHLLATFQTFDEDGHPAGEGSIEKYLFSPGNMKIITTFDGHTSTGYYTDGKPLYTDDGFTGSILTYFVRDFVLVPLFPAGAFAKRETKTSAVTLLGTEMDCAGFQFKIRAGNVPQPPPDSYCVSRKTHDLVMHQTESFSARYRDFAPFLDRSIARTIVVSKGPQTRIRIKIETLDDAVLPEAERVAPANAVAVDAGPEIRAYDPKTELVRVGGIDLSEPSQGDRAAHLAGLEIVYALVSRQGKVIDVEPSYISNPGLTKIAINIAKSGTYKPLIRAGVPVEDIVTVYIPIRF
jgi:hypothetical protein